MEISETSHNESGPPIRENGTVESPAEDEVNDEESNMETVDLGMNDTSATDASSPNVFKNIDNEAPEGPADVTSSEEAAEVQETNAPEEKVEEIVIPSAPTPAPPQDVSPTAAIESLPPLPEGKELELEDDVTSSLPRLLSKTTLIHSNEEGADETIQRLVTALHSNSPNTDRTQIVDNLFNLLVGGHFDQESKFVIEEASNVDHMLTLLSHCDADLQNEIWSLFLAVMKKSNRNLEACTRVGLISKVLDLLPEAPPLLADLLVQIIAALVAYSINVKQTKNLLRALKSTKDQWSPNSLKLLHVLKEMPQHDSADVFFSFPGKDQSGIILPPIKMMPYQQGWTFATWLRMEPLNSVTFEKEQPVLYSFRTSKGIGYSCHFTGNCLVVNVEKTKGKEQSRCIRAELGARKWHHIAIAHCYSRWGRSDIKCFIDGQLAETIELSWVVTSPTNWDRCSIGGSADGTANTAFCGQMGAMYLFAEALSLQQANSLFCLGPAYQSTFKHDSETSLPEGYKKHLFDGHLHSSLVFAYCPKNCHGQLCLYTPPKTVANTYFVQIPHAVMKEGVEVITTHSIHKSLQSVEGIQILLPLFAQIDLSSSHDNSIDGEVCQILLSLISLLLSSSQSSQQQLFHSKGFLIISSCLQKASPSHLSMKVLEQLIHIAKFLLRCPAGSPLLKHLFDYILFNPKLWIRARPEVQVHLYQYLATDSLANNNFSSMLRRVPTVIEMCHTLKHFYWLALSQTASVYTVEERPENFATADIVAIRSATLTFINRIVVAPSGSPEEEEKSRDQEVHTLLNLLATVRKMELTFEHNNHFEPLWIERNLNLRVRELVRPVRDYLVEQGTVPARIIPWHFGIRHGELVFDARHIGQTLNSLDPPRQLIFFLVRRHNENHNPRPHSPENPERDPEDSPPPGPRQALKPRNVMPPQERAVQQQQERQQRDANGEQDQSSPQLYSRVFVAARGAATGHATAQASDNCVGYFEKIAYRFKGIPLPTETEAPKSMFDACNKEWSAPELLPAVPNDFKEHPDRDLTNYTCPSRPMYPPKSRLLVIPDSWFTPFQKVTGTSGPYLFFGELFGFLVNKELWVFEEQGHMTVGWILFYLLVSRTVGYKIDAGLYKDYQDRVGFFKGLIQEDLKKDVDFRKTSAKHTESLAALKESMPASLKESMQLQIEAVYRKNVQTVSNEIKRRIDYLKETEETKARLERDQLLKLINESVEKQVSQKDFQEKFLQNIKTAGTPITYDVSHYRNVSIIAQYIRQKTENAQFIIISLRNNMFELANRLVGIYKVYGCTKNVSIDPQKVCELAKHLSDQMGKQTCTLPDEVSRRFNETISRQNKELTAREKQYPNFPSSSEISKAEKIVSVEGRVRKELNHTDSSSRPQSKASDMPSTSRADSRANHSSAPHASERPSSQRTPRKERHTDADETTPPVKRSNSTTTTTSTRSPRRNLAGGGTAERQDDTLPLDGEQQEQEHEHEEEEE